VTAPMFPMPGAEMAMDDAFALMRAEAPPATSLEIDAAPSLQEQEAEAEARRLGQDVAGVPTLEEELDLPEQDSEVVQAITTLYGHDFPLLMDDAQEKDWVSWANNAWLNLGPTVQRRLWLVERNRLFRNGIQWVSSNGYGPWREPPRPRDAARVVRNMIKPALDQRIQIVSEQRPGFRVRPQTMDPDDKARAEAKQIALEYQYDQQNMAQIQRELAYWTGTDGACFLEMYWDPDAGPWHEMYYQGEGEGSGNPEAAQQPGRKEPLGDVRPRVRRIETVRVSANASANKAPWFWVIKDVMSKQEAIRMYGIDVAESPNGADPSTSMFQNYPQIRMGFQLPNIDELLLEQDKVIRFTIYIEKSLALPKGMTLVVVGDKVVHQGPLMMGMVPMVRFTDGSTDPSFFPEAVMEGWIDAQMRINAVLSKWVENIRYNSGARLLAKESSIAPETYTAANMSIISVKGLGGLNEIARPLDSFSVGLDAKELLAMETKQFEDLSGWNDVSRGQFQADTSGRAILAIREQLERVFAPPVNAMAYGMTQWAKICCSWMAWGYDMPRMLAVEGKGRPDLARAVMTDDFDGVTDVFIDPETLMPMPRALRLFLLKDMMEQGLLSPQEYRRRMPFAYTRDIGTPDEDQEARAKRVCEALRQGQELPLLWQDNESIHQDVLDRELILPDDTPPPVRQAAQQRWMMLAQQAMMKGQMMGGMGSPAAPPPPEGGGGQPQPGLPATDQPFASTNPSVAANQWGIADDQRAARQFDSQQKMLDQEPL